MLVESFNTLPHWHTMLLPTAKLQTIWTCRDISKCFGGFTFFPTQFYDKREVVRTPNWPHQPTNNSTAVFRKLNHNIAFFMWWKISRTFLYCEPILSKWCPDFVCSSNKKSNWELGQKLYIVLGDAINSRGVILNPVKRRRHRLVLRNVDLS